MRKILAAATILSASIFTFQINFYLGLTLLSGLILSFAPNIGKIWGSIGLRFANFIYGRERTLRIKFSLREFNGLLCTIQGNMLRTFAEISAPDLIAMRGDTQRIILQNLRLALDNCMVDIDIFSAQQDMNVEKHELLNFRSYISFSASSRNDELEISSFRLHEEIVRFQGRLGASGIKMSPIRDKKRLKKILYKQISGQTSEESTVEGRDRGQEFPVVRYRKHRRYIESGLIFADLVVRDSDYDSGPFYQTILESMKIPFNLRASIRRVGKGNPMKFLNTQIAERKAEIRVSGLNTKFNAFLRSQLNDLERIRRMYENEKSVPLDVTIIIRVFSNHPVDLASNLSRVKNSLGMLGIKAEEMLSKNDSIQSMISPSLDRANSYLMSSVHVANLLPIFRGSEPEETGILLGVDDLSERLIYFDPFQQNSHNALIVGETGSGKSFFVKLFLIRALRDRIARRIFIFDPLNEYFCQFFGTDCRELSPFEFLRTYDISHEREENARSHFEEAPSAVTIIKISSQQLEDELLLQDVMKKLNEGMMGNADQLPSIIALDESHILFRKNSTSGILSSMVRHSRHYNTSVLNISQNIDDFLNARTSNVALNSSRIFLFRSRSFREQHAKILKLDDFSYDSPENLMGGKMHPYSECVVSDGTYCRKLRIYSSPEEDRILQ